MPRLSIILPVLNEAGTIRAALYRLARYRSRGVQVIVADGGSQDDTIELARPLADRVLTAPRGRARQMNAGAAASTGDILMFLHCDCVLPDDADQLVLDALARSTATASGVADCREVWGRFDVQIEGRHRLLHLVAAMMNMRSRLTGIATGDQAMFVRREAFDRAGQFPDIPLMEDIALSRALKRISPPLCLRARVTASGRRWEKNGVIRTIVLMWYLRLAYFLGASPGSLARRYNHVAG